VYLLDVQAGTLSRIGDRAYGLPEQEQRYVDVRSNGITVLRDRVTGREIEPPADMIPVRGPFSRDASFSDSVAAFSSNSGFALIGREAGDPETCRVVRYDPDGAILSDASFGCAPSWDGPYLSPDGSLIAANLLPKESPHGPGSYRRLTAVSLFDAETGEELFRIKSAFWFSGDHLARAPETFWLPDSSGLVVTTSRGNRIVTAEGEWAPLPDRLQGTWFVPSPTEPLRFLLNHYDGDSVAVLDEDGGLVASTGAEVQRSPEEHPDSFLVVSPWWGATSREVHMAVWFQGPTSFIELTAVLPPVIERAPIEERLLVRVAADGPCLDIQEAPASSSPTVTCLEDGSIVETVESPRGSHTETSYSECPTWRCTWIHVRTQDGTKGWALSDNLRWAKGEPPPDSGG